MLLIYKKKMLLHVYQIPWMQIFECFDTNVLSVHAYSTPNK